MYTHIHTYKFMHTFAEDEKAALSRRSRPMRKSANVGSSRVLECEVRYPDDDYVQHIITWRKQGLDSPIFILFDGYPPRMDASYRGRIRLVGGQGSIEISDIRASDEGWYECSVLFLDKSDDATANGTWIHLSVNGERPIIIIMNRCRILSWQVRIRI